MTGNRRMNKRDATRPAKQAWNIATPRQFADEVVSDEMARVLREKTPAERLQIAFGMWRSASRMILVNLRRQHPDWTSRQLEQETARRIDSQHEAWFASAEDVILKKLVYFNEGGSEKHLRDIVGILKVQGDQIDFDYLKHWCGLLEVQSGWKLIEDRLGARGRRP